MGSARSRLPRRGPDAHGAPITTPRHTTIDEGRSALASYGQILEVIVDALGLEPADRSRVLAAVAGKANQSLNLGWDQLPQVVAPLGVEPG